MIREHFEIGQTAVTIISEYEYISIAKDAIFDARSQIEMKIAQDPFFRTTYEPYLASAYDGAVVKRMCDASLLASVGPMAAVAGAIAEYAVERMIAAGSKHAIVDNGGDIAMICDRDVLVGMYIDVNGQRLSLKVPPSDHMIGICSSSASVGPSVSLGSSDISTVISRNVSLADACATTLGNLIKDGDRMTEHLEIVCEIDGVTGCLAYCDGMFGICGDVPEIVRTDADDDIITRIFYG
ncbi:MAG: UPF0280 family protein [Methanomassiliicoccaceae archaeon]|jgi:ApbE superfamily uncharacterized protein (UPF0280 family)|nr:UPF0280 family protein [Methanomassiliicoccaceae archaeon]